MPLHIASLLPPWTCLGRAFGSRVAERCDVSFVPIAGDASVTCRRRCRAVCLFAGCESSSLKLHPKRAHRRNCDAATLKPKRISAASAAPGSAAAEAQQQHPHTNPQTDESIHHHHHRHRHRHRILHSGESAPISSASSASTAWPPPGCAHSQRVFAMLDEGGSIAHTATAVWKCWRCITRATAAGVWMLASASSSAAPSASAAFFLATRQRQLSRPSSSLRLRPRLRQLSVRARSYPAPAPAPGPASQVPFRLLACLLACCRSTPHRHHPP